MSVPSLVTKKEAETLFSFFLRWNWLSSSHEQTLVDGESVAIRERIPALR